MWSLSQTAEDTQRFLLRRMRIVPEFGAAMTVNSGQYQTERVR